ncbi:flocculation protein FLO11-like [Cucumis melo var. makuwa]|uniref:Flocculation protein FLO11-like n=1 Tax=Cucumis melo var. makuwa TaxID=1194695 RepID=A0A5D3DEW8_CUCMM|nr:flocculation protein FLO11-like [Cucumis melo var. makuwa]
MVTTPFKKYPSGISSSKNFSAPCSSESMDPAASKSVTSSKGKRYKGILTKHLYKKARKSIPSGDNSAVPSPEQSSHAKRSTNPPSPVTVKEEVLEFSSRRSARPSVSSSVPKSSSRPKPRISVETVSSGGVSPKMAPPQSSEHTKYSGAPSFQASLRTAPPSVANDDDDDDSDDEDYAPGTEEKIEAEATFKSTEDQSASYEKDPSDLISTEESGESSIPRSTEGLSEFLIPVSPPVHVASFSGFRRPPTKGQQVVSTKAGRRKGPPNVPFVPIDCYNYCPAILELIRNAGLIRTVSEVGPFYPRLMRELIVNLPSDFNDSSADKYQKVHIRGVCFNVSPELLNAYLGLTMHADYAVSYPTLERLVEELIGGTVPVWPVDGQLPVASLTVKYSILHQIGISNWISSMHASTISTSLGHFVYLVGIQWLSSGSTVHHSDSSRYCWFSTSGYTAQYALVSRAHIPDVAAEFDNALSEISTPAASQPAVGHSLTLSVSLVNRLLQALIVESRALTR